MNLRLPLAAIRSHWAPLLFAAALGLANGAQGVHAGDWPQILGPHRDGVATGESLYPEKKIPWDRRKPEQVGAPTPLWGRGIGTGYAGPIVVDGVVYLLHRQGSKNLLEAYDLQKGQLTWGVNFPASYQGGVSPDNGPRATPVAVADPADARRRLIVCFTAEGDLHVVRTPIAGEERGSVLWSRELADEYQAPEGYFGAGSTPIVVGDRILLNLGGRDGAGIVALKLLTGETIWKATDEQASYSSPIETTLGDRRAVVFVTRLSLLGIDPTDGDVLFTTRFGQVGPTVNAAAPVQVGKSLFVTASYRIGARLVDPTGGDVRDVWGNDEVLSSQYVTPLLHDGYLYGCDGREDQGTTDLVCVHATEGKEMWRVPGAGVTHLIGVGDMALGLGIDGMQTQFPLDPGFYKPVAQAKLLPPHCRAIPALSDGILVARQTDDEGGELIALRVGPPSVEAADSQGRE